LSSSSTFRGTRLVLIVASSSWRTSGSFFPLQSNAKSSRTSPHQVSMATGRIVF
jgi:hypothetical protein